MKPDISRTRKNPPNTPAPPYQSDETPQLQDAPRNVGLQTGRASQSAHTEPGRRFLHLLGSGIVVGVAGCTGTESGANKVVKAEVKYQDQITGNQQCSNCQFFISPEDSDAAGMCSHVEGAIEPNDWWSVSSSQ